MSQLAQVHATPGLAGYMAEVEAGLAQAVATEPGLAQEVAGEALAAGGKRLRPLLCFLTARGEPAVPPAVAVRKQSSGRSRLPPAESASPATSCARPGRPVIARASPASTSAMYAATPGVA